MMKTVVEEITPEKAREYLKANTNNYRKLKRAIVRKYAEEMKAGRWQLNGESICFSESGVLKNGQHRLAAIILSNTPIKTNVTRGVSEKVNNYDIGSVRNNRDILLADGYEPDSTTIAAANIIVNKFRGSRGGSEVREYYKAHENDLTRALRITCYGTGAKSKNSPSVAATYLMLRTNYMPSYECELFFRLMNDFGYTQADGYEISPALVAQRMFDTRGTKHSGQQIQKERLEILIMAMKDFHEGVKRTENYKIQEPFQFTEFLKKVRKEDGLKED